MNVDRALQATTMSSADKMPSSENINSVLRVVLYVGESRHDWEAPEPRLSSRLRWAVATDLYRCFRTIQKIPDRRARYGAHAVALVCAILRARGWTGTSWVDDAGFDRVRAEVAGLVAADIDLPGSRTWSARVIQQYWRHHSARRHAAARTIQRACLPWLVKPVTADGKTGISVRLMMREAEPEKLHEYLTETHVGDARCTGVALHATPDGSISFAVGEGGRCDICGGRKAEVARLMVDKGEGCPVAICEPCIRDMFARLQDMDLVDHA